MKRVQIYKIIATLLPLFILVVVELCMRTGDYGYNTRLFQSDEDPDFWVMNQDISKKYFLISQNATIGNKETFYKKKPDGTLRFFVLGASSALGFPYMHNGAFPRMLKYKLQFLFPENNIEVINLSLTAINTYTLYDFAKQIVDYAPDGILIYAGHNEFYGALGVASSSRIGRNPQMIQLMLAAQELKLVQELNLLMGKLRPHSALTDTDRTLMERMAAHQLVPYESSLYNAAIKQFDRNLDKIFHLFQKHQIPVFLSTLTGNLKGQAPLSGEKTPPYDATEEYLLGEQAYKENHYEKALSHYGLARDYDPLRFRAPEAFNQIIRKHSEEQENVFLVDAYQTIADHSPHGITGDELLLEHVHPNLTGHQLIAETFYQALAAHFFPQKGLTPSTYQIDLTVDFPNTAFDSIYGDRVIHQLKQQWPFNESPSPFPYDKDDFVFQTVENFFLKNINWGQAMQRINNHYILEEDFTNALRVVEQMCLELPHEKVFLQQAGSLCVRLGETEKAAYYFQKAKLISPPGSK